MASKIIKTAAPDIQVGSTIHATSSVLKFETDERGTTIRIVTTTQWAAGGTTTFSIDENRNSVRMETEKVGFTTMSPLRQELELICKALVACNPELEGLYCKETSGTNPWHLDFFQKIHTSEGTEDNRQIIGLPPLGEHDTQWFDMILELV